MVRFQPSQHGCLVTIRAYAEPLLDLEPLHLLPGDVAAPTPTPPLEIEVTEVKEAIRDALTHLSTYERTVVQLYFGFVTVEPWTLPEIAALLQVENSEVARLLASALRKLRGPLAHLA